MKTLHFYNGIFTVHEKKKQLCLPMQEVEFNHFRDVKLYQLGSKFIKKSKENHSIFLI